MSDGRLQSKQVVWGSDHGTLGVWFVLRPGDEPQSPLHPRGFTHQPERGFCYTQPGVFCLWHPGGNGEDGGVFFLFWLKKFFEKKNFCFSCTQRLLILSHYLQKSTSPLLKGSVVSLVSQCKDWLISSKCNIESSNSIVADIFGLKSEGSEGPNQVSRVDPEIVQNAQSWFTASENHCISG